MSTCYEQSRNGNNILLAMTLIRDDFRGCPARFFARFFARFCTNERRSIARRCRATARLAVAARPTNRSPSSCGMSVMAAMGDVMPALQRASTNESDPPVPRNASLEQENSLEI